MISLRFLAFPRHRLLWRGLVPLLDPADTSHDRYHLQRVYLWVLRLAAEAGADPDLAGAAALVHDLVLIPKESAGRALAADLSADRAAPLLVQAGYSPSEWQEIAAAVRTSSWSRGLPPANPIGLALREADRLDALGALGIARNFATCQAMASRGQRVRFCHPADPLGASARALDDTRQALDHFQIKLLRLAGTLTLPTACAEAARRHQFLLAFLQEFAREAVSPSGEAP